MTEITGFLGLDACTHCGFCLPACPTWQEQGEEGASPRGRIVLMRALAEGELPAEDPVLFEQLSSCTLCLACEPACPSGVRFGEGYAAATIALARHGITLRPATP